MPSNTAHQFSIPFVFHVDYLYFFSILRVYVPWRKDLLEKVSPP